MRECLQHRMRPVAWRALTFALTLACAPALGLDRGSPATPLPIPPSGVIGMQDAYFAPEFWIARTRAADQVLMTPTAIQARNARLLQVDDSMHDLSALPATLDRRRVAGWIDDLASAPSKPLWDEAGKPVPKATLDAIVASRAIDAIPASQPTRFGMVVQRTALRAFPTDLRVFNRQGETHIDRFQESALFPGDSVAIVHASSDAKWLFIVSERYAAWVAADAIAEGERATVLAYATRAPYRIVTGAKPRTGRSRIHEAYGCWPFTGLSGGRFASGMRTPMSSCSSDRRGSSRVNTVRGLAPVTMR